MVILTNKKYWKFFIVFLLSPLILIEFVSGRRSPNQSAKNRLDSAHGLNCKIFVNSEVIFKNHRNFGFLATFEFSNGNICQMAKNIGNFFRDF